MSRQKLKSWTVLVLSIMVATGCQPIQPTFLTDKNYHPSHYRDVAQEIEYPDYDQPPLDEVAGAHAPLTLENADKFNFWDLSLQECVRITLSNSQVMRNVGGRFVGSVTTPSFLNTATGGPQALPITTYDPAIVESGYGVNTGSPLSGTGVEAALSEFDAQLESSVFWEDNDRPQNISPAFAGVFPPVLRQDLGRFRTELRKTAATGGQFAFRNNTLYDDQKFNPARALQSTWTTDFEFAFNQPLLQGAGAQYNRIAGIHAYDAANRGLPNNPDGVMIARIRVDLALAEFEYGVRNLLEETETAYWELYFAYRALEADKVGRNSALESWKKINALKTVGAVGGEAEKEAQARAQYFLFQAEAEARLTELYAAETRLRYLMGLAVSDGRLIRPKDEPTMARVDFDWHVVLPEATVRRCEVRKQKWEIKKEKLELIAARNHLLPRLDIAGQYRFLGMGQDLINANGTGLGPQQPGSNAWEQLVLGNFQEWQLGAQFSMPIGFRRALSGVRHQELLLARGKAILEDLELEVSHQLGDSLRNVTNNYTLTQTNFNRRLAAQNEVEAVQTAYEAGTVTLDLLLRAQQRRADAEVAYYRSLVNYNLDIMRVHRNKGSLLEFNGVYLAEGPWPKKAYFDAVRLARRRDAARHLNYGYTRPRVVSRGPYAQFTHDHDAVPGEEVLRQPTLEEVPSEPVQEELPAPEPSMDSVIWQEASNRGGEFESRRTAARSAKPRAAAKLRLQAGDAAHGPLLRSPSGGVAPVDGTAVAKPSVIKLSYEEFSSGNDDANATSPNRATLTPASGWKRVQRP